MKRDWSIRKAEPQDAAELTQCMIDAYSPYMERLGGRTLPPMEVNYSEEIDTCSVWVAVSENAIVGGLIMSFEKQYASLANLCVHPDFQGCGLGREIIEFAELAAKKKGFAEMRLATHVLLTENISLYKYLGWSEVNSDDVRVYMGKMI